jgi:hypothetical protein
MLYGAYYVLRTYTILRTFVPEVMEGPELGAWAIVMATPKVGEQDLPWGNSMPQARSVYIHAKKGCNLRYEVYTILLGKCQLDRSGRVEV